MKNKYIDLIDQTYYFPQDEFTLDGDELRFHNIDLMELVRTSTKEHTTIVIALKVRISNT